MSIPVDAETCAPAKAFLAQNVFADYAIHAADKAEDAPHGTTAEHYWLSMAQTYATLALAYEQRMMRFDMLGIARGEL